MESLHEIVDIVTRFSNVHQSQFRISLEKSPKMLQLFELARNSDIMDDEEACVRLYGNVHHIHSFREVKRRLKNRILNALLFLGQGNSEFSDIQHAFFMCHRNWAAIRLLISRGAHIAATEIAERTLRVTKKYEFTETSLLISQQLQFHYAVVAGQRKKHQEYKSRVISYQYIYEAELAAERVHSDLMVLYGHSQRTLSKRTLKKYEYLINNLLNKYKDVSSLRFLRISRLAKGSFLEASCEFRKALDVYKEAVKLVMEKPFEAKNVIFTFEMRSLVCFIALGKFRRARELALHYSKNIQKGTYNWHAVMYHYFILCARSQNYIELWEVLKEATGHKHFYKQKKWVKELWHINNAYAHFLVARGKITPEQDDEPPPFRIYKFLNEVPIYSRDKRGINISILIIHVLFLLHQRRFGKIIDRVDALNQYCYRHLRRDETFRSNCFIKMLIQVPKAGFNRIRTERYAEKYRKKLDSMPLSKARQGIEVEVFPYEHLWEMVLEMLK